jgi:UDP-N-acetylmuramoylalanine--D-glutamate ligase
VNAQVLGLGASGQAAARLLRHLGQSVWVFDEGDSPLLQQRRDELMALGIDVEIATPFQLRPDTQQLVVSPGVNWHHPVLAQARARAIPIVGEAELAWQFLQQVPWLGITGTNGKTTTTALVAAMFQAAGLQAPACGNIGLPLCTVALEALQTGQYPDWIVAELSSYQLEAAPTLAPQIGIWTTFTPDHLERHGTLERYAAIKSSLVERARQAAVLNGDDSYLWDHRDRWPQACWTSISHNGVRVQLAPDSSGGNPWVWLDNTALLPLDAFPLLGDHNRQNLLMAAAAASLAGIPPQSIQSAIAHFPGVPHRLQRICTLNGIDFINDSKATNYDAAQVGLASISTPVVLIAGGQPKLGNDRPWLDTIRAKVATTILMGKAAPQFATRLQELEYTDYEIVETLDMAVPLAYERATALASAMPFRRNGHPTSLTPSASTSIASSPAVTVLFSPACASYDQYPNFEVRGQHFQTCCEQLAR